MRIYIVTVFILLFAACNSDAPKTEGANTTQVTDEGDKGRTLFQQNCATCHNLMNDISGPALGGVLQRWDNDTARLKAFIRNPAKLISEGDPSAIKAAERFKPTVMTAFPGLTDEQLNDLITYCQNGH